MPKDIDDNFYERADAHIHLSNEQIADAGRGKASASMMYAAARFNAWVSACRFSTTDEMAAAREGEIEYFVDQYRVMLEENFDDYVTNFSKYMTAD